MLNKFKRLTWIKYSVAILIAMILVALLYWRWLDVSLVRRIPNISEFARGMYDSGNRWMIDYLIHLEEKMQAFLVIVVLFLLSNVTIKYKLTEIIRTKQKVLIGVMVICIVLDLVTPICTSIPCYIIIDPICWYILLQTIFEPIPMFKKKSKQTPISSNS